MSSSLRIIGSLLLECLRVLTTFVSVLAFSLLGSALARKRWDLPGYCLFSLSGSVRPSIPGGHDRLALAPITLLPAGGLKPSALSKAVFSGLHTFTVGFTRYHCSSPAFVSTHQVHCCQRPCKARYPARGLRLPERDSHPLEFAAVPSRNQA